MSPETQITEKSFEEKELIERISWLITIRWSIVAGICAISLFAYFVLAISLPIMSILIVASGILLYNVICIYYQHYIKCISYQQYLKSHQRLANLQISLDWIALVALSHYTGGIESPMILYFIFNVIISAILLSRKSCYLQATLALLLMSCLSILEYEGVIPHVRINELFPISIYDNGLYLLSILFFLTTSLYISAYLATTITYHLRKREREVIILKNNCNIAYNTCNIAYKRLKTIDKEKSEFTYKVTHELRAPLSAIQSLLKSIEEGYAGEISQKAKELIIRSEKRTGFLLLLVNDLLDLVAGKIGGLREGERKTLNTNEVIKNIVQLLQEMATAKGLKLVVNTTPTPSYINIIPDDLELIITNLIDNAIKYTETGGTVSISNISASEVTSIEISDTGIGIREDDASKIFDEFYRANNAKAVELNGTGLGLSIVNNLINRYGGSIKVQSILGKGTTFTITFSNRAGPEQKRK